MGITNIATIMVAISLSWLPASCSKSSTKPVAKHGAPANPNDMGELMLTNGVETIVHLGSGKSCRIKPTLVDKRNVQLTMALETKQTNGKIGSMSVAQTTTTRRTTFGHQDRRDGHEPDASGDGKRINGRGGGI